MQRRIAIAAFVVFSGHAATTRDDAAQSRKLVGNWRAVRSEVAGKPVPAHQLPTKLMSFTSDGRWSWGTTDGTWVADDIRSPKTLDLTETGRDTAVKELAIYTAIGDTLTIAFAIPGDPVRPTALDASNADPESRLFVFWRVR